MIVFACPNPNCQQRYKVIDSWAGKTTTCANPACRLRIQVPRPPRKPDPVPGDLIDEETGAVIKDWRDESAEASPRSRNVEPEPEADEPEPRYEPPPYRRSRRREMGPGNRIMAGIGAALLLIGQFLPMLNGPFGLWMSFVDLPWKALTIGLQAVDTETERGAPRQQREPRREAAGKREGPPKVIAAVATIAVLYPASIFGVIAAAFFQICGGRGRKLFTLLGTVALSATALYGIALLALNTQQDFRIVMVAVSPGFGWAVVLVGALALTGAGMIRPASLTHA